MHQNLEQRQKDTKNYEHPCPKTKAKNRHKDNKIFLFNSSAKCRAGGHFKWKPDLSLTDQQIAVDNKASHFQALFQDVNYQNPPLTGDVEMANKVWNIWKSTPFDCWQCQLNFTPWCAIAGCGVSFKDHLQAKDPLLASLYWFHVYYTTRRILEELRITLPGDESHYLYQKDYDANIPWRELTLKTLKALNTLE